MARTVIQLKEEGSPIGVDLTVGHGRTIERFDSVRYLKSGKAVDLARKGVHAKVYQAVLTNLHAGAVKFEPGEDPDNIYISKEGLARFDDQNG